MNNYFFKSLRLLNDTPSMMVETPSYESMFLKMILALIGIVVAVFLGIWLIKKLSYSRSRQMNILKSVKILEKRPLSPKSMLYLIEVSGRKLLLSESQLEVRALSDLKWIEEPSHTDT